MAQTITQDNLDSFLNLCHSTFLRVPAKEDPQDCIGHIYSVLVPDESVLDPVAMLHLSRRYPLNAALDQDGHGVAMPIDGIDSLWFAFAPLGGGDDINQQLEEMTLPRGSIAFGFSFESFVVKSDLDGVESGPMKIRQTLVAAPGGQISSLITMPSGTDYAAGLAGKTITLIKEVVERIPG